MAVVVAEIKGGNQEFYERVSEKTMGGQLPEGAQVHIAGPMEGGWRVITVWDSEEQFHRFRDEKLIPTLSEVGDPEGPEAPRLQADPVHRLLTA